MSKKLLAFVFSLALAFGFMSANAGFGDDPAPGGAPPAATPSPDEEPRFDELDTDGDGRVSRAEAAAEPCLAQAFDEIADDPDEGLTEDEFEEAVDQYC